MIKTNAVDINKRVLYAHDEKGGVRGRCLFALTRHGAIAGVILFFTALAAAAGPLAMGAVSDAWDDPRAGFVLATVFSFLLLAGLSFNWMADPAGRRLQATGSAA